MAKTDLIWAGEETMNSLLNNLILSNPVALAFLGNLRPRNRRPSEQSVSFDSLRVFVTLC